MGGDLWAAQQPNSQKPSSPSTSFPSASVRPLEQPPYHDARSLKLPVILHAGENSAEPRNQHIPGSSPQEPVSRDHDNKRWSSNSFDDLPEGRLAGSFAAWAQPVESTQPTEPMQPGTSASPSQPSFNAYPHVPPGQNLAANNGDSHNNGDMRSNPAGSSLHTVVSEAFPSDYVAAAAADAEGGGGSSSGYVDGSGGVGYSQGDYTDDAGRYSSGVYDAGGQYGSQYGQSYSGDAGEYGGYGGGGYSLSGGEGGGSEYGAHYGAQYGSSEGLQYGSISGEPQQRQQWGHQGQMDPEADDTAVGAAAHGDGYEAIESNAAGNSDGWGSVSGAAAAVGGGDVQYYYDPSTGYYAAYGSASGTTADDAAATPEWDASAAAGDATAAAPEAAAATAAADGAATAASTIQDLEGMLSLLQQQRQQYRSWVAQCAVTALSALDPSYSDPSYEHTIAASSSGSTLVPEDVSSMVAAMDVAGTVRQYLLSLKAAAEATKEAARAAAAFEALALPVAESYDSPADVAAGEAAEAEYVSAAYGVTSAVVAAVETLKATTALVTAGASGVSSSSEEALKELLPPEATEAPLRRRLERIGSGLATRLREEADVLMGRLHWPPPLAAAAGTTDATATATAAAAGGEAGRPDALRKGVAEGGTFAGFEAHPVLARRLAGVLTALTHFQMAVEQRPAFIRLLSTQPGEEEEGGEEAAGEEGGDGASKPAAATKPVLWAAKALAAPIAAKLRTHFHPAAPTGRLDRPAWLYGTVLDFVRHHGHALSSLDDILACLQLKPHYNMPAEFARALQDEVLEFVREVRIPAIINLQTQIQNPTADTNGSGDDSTSSAAAASTPTTATDADVEALWMGLMDASASYDISMLPLLGATGAAVEAAAAKATAMLATAAAATGGPSRRRACDVLDPTVAGTADMHGRYVAVAALATATPVAAAAPGEQPAEATPKEAEAAKGALSPLLVAWAEAEGAAALRAVEAVVYDDSSLTPQEEVLARRLGASTTADDDTGSTAAAATSAAAAAGGAAPWQRDVWPPVVAVEAARVLDGLVARSRWLSPRPLAQQAFLAAAAVPVLALLRRRLARVLDGAVARGEVLSEEGLPKVCAALCAAHFLDEHLHSLLLTELAPLVHALESAAAAAAAVSNSAAASGVGTPASSIAGGSAVAVPPGKLGGGGGGGFWSGLLAAAAGGNGTAVAASPARVALRDGVTALAGAASAAFPGAAGGSVTSAAAAAAGAGCTAAAAAVFGEYVRAFSRLHRDGCLKVAREMALGFGRYSLSYRHAIEANTQFPFTPEEEVEAEGDRMGMEAEARPMGHKAADSNGGGVGSSSGSTSGQRAAASITPSFAPALLFLQTSLSRLSRCCDKATFADVWRGAALSINRFMFNFVATESRFTRAGARQFAADVWGLASLFAPYSRRGASATATAAGGQHFRELQAAARLLCMEDEEAADVMRRASTAAVAVAAAAGASFSSPASRLQSSSRPLPAAGCDEDEGGPLSPTKHRPLSTTHAMQPQPQQKQHGNDHKRGGGGRDAVRVSMAADPLLSSGGLACLTPLQIMNVIEHRI
ncbi:hypothetical protein Agub_g3798 [Astrephomene gubernaculifera]|uniref:Uncharacterized protein n=1 Tax=Astrephomene gubernaculifera TaxID=47775 RepID=A0AAD3DJ73_9CHLO|nr:hypothetical protein Agub_g3798 [Astrephomene gubernaculifera]